VIKVRSKRRSGFFRGGLKFTPEARILTEPGDDLPEHATPDLTEDQSKAIRAETRFLDVQELSAEDIEPLSHDEKRELVVRHAARNLGKSEAEVKKDLDQAIAEQTANAAGDQANAEDAGPDPHAGSEPTDAEGDSSTAEDSGVVSINTATADQLAAVKGIGPETAAAIVAMREQEGEFSSIADLVKVSGLGKASVKKLAGLVTV
jgi:competence protein ComEA